MNNYEELIDQAKNAAEKVQSQKEIESWYDKYNVYKEHIEVELDKTFFPIDMNQLKLKQINDFKHDNYKIILNDIRRQLDYIYRDRWYVILWKFIIDFIQDTKSLYGRFDH